MVDEGWEVIGFPVTTPLDTEWRTDRRSSDWTLFVAPQQLQSCFVRITPHVAQHMPGGADSKRVSTFDVANEALLPRRRSCLTFANCVDQKHVIENQDSGWTPLHVASHWHFFPHHCGEENNGTEWTTDCPPDVFHGHKERAGFVAGVKKPV